MKTIAVVVNKNWETEPVLNALTNSELRPKAFPFPQISNSPKDGQNKMIAPRGIFYFENEGIVSIKVSIWCIQDLMYFNVKPNPETQSSSSSEEKFRILSNIFSTEKPDLIIAVGTAGYPSDKSINGSVIIGANFFIHNGNENNIKSKLTNENIGKLLQCNVNPKLFSLINEDFKNKVLAKFIPVPINPANPPVCLSSENYSAISSINVTDYNQYEKVDKQAVEHYKNVERNLEFVSLETTHGVIKLRSDNTPIMFLSAITDRIGYFKSEVTATQNYVASFNAGIVLAELLCSINDLFLSDETLTMSK
jgi:hypothetical protein